MPTVVAFTARSAVSSASWKAGAWSPADARLDQSDPVQLGHQARGGVGCAIADHDTPDAGRQAGEDDRTGSAAGARHDHIDALEGSTHGELDSRPEARRIGVETDQPSVIGPGDVVDGTDGPRVGLDVVHEARHDLLVGRRDPEPEPIRPASLPDGRRDRVGLELEEHITSVDAGRGEGGIVHDLRMAAPERHPEQRDLAGHGRVTGAPAPPAGRGRAWPGRSRSG